MVCPVLVLVLGLVVLLVLNVLLVLVLYFVVVVHDPLLVLFILLIFVRVWFLLVLLPVVFLFMFFVSFLRSSAKDEHVVPRDLPSTQFTEMFLNRGWKTMKTTGHLFSSGAKVYNLINS